jgi:nucleoside-diphosphate-sugar epimerase
MEHPAALNEDFNISTDRSTTVLELAEVIWRKIKDPDVPFRYVSEDAYEYDVQKRVPAVDKARRLLGFECTTSLESMLDEVIPWIEMAIAEGRI